MDKKTLSIVSYITIIGWIIAYVSYNGKQNKSSLEKYHLKQSLGLGILGLIIGIVGSIVVFATGSYLLATVLNIASIGVLVLWILGIINASNEAEKPVPLVGTIFQNQFQFIQ